ncbi:MAG: hypothetical protein ACI9U2_000153, partial [Bradymonadia bacterium]
MRILLCLLLLAVGCDDSSPPCPANRECVFGDSCNQLCFPQCRSGRDCPSNRCVGGACAPPGVDVGVDLGDADMTLDARASDAGLGDAQPVDMAVDAAPRPEGQGDLTGQVHFRLYDDSILPVARPIVYWTFPNERPEPLTRGASCDCGYPVTAARGDADGRFMLRNIPAGPIWLVVQKGAFRRIVEVQVRPDVQTPLPEAVTALPVRQDP